MYISLLGARPQDRSARAPFLAHRLKALALLGTIVGCHSPPNLSHTTDLGAPPALPTARPIGLDMPDLLRMYLGLAPGGPAAAQHQMDLAHARGFTHARVEGSPFWPSEMTGPTGWKSHPDVYFAAFDAFLADARARGLRIIPSLLFQNFLFSDVAGEPRGQLFVPGSASRMLAERYVTAVVTRYAHNDAVLFWEIGNEWNNDADIDYGICSGASAPGYCRISPSLGTPMTRTAADNYFSCDACRGVSSTQQDLGAFMGAIAQLIHGIDPSRRVSSGNSYPRPFQYHLAHLPCPACDYTYDTAAQYEAIQMQLHPAAVDMISVHHYFGSLALFGDTDGNGAPLMARTQALATRLGKQLYVGEYGELSPGSVTCSGQTTTCGGDASKPFTERTLDALVASEVDWSGLWAYEDYQLCAGVPTCFTVTDGDPLIQSMLTHDQAYGSCLGRSDGTACPIGACSAQRCVSAVLPPTPTTLQSWSFASAADLAQWSVTTNCTGCTPGTFTIAGSGADTFAELTANDLPCSGSCQSAVVAALWPPIAVPSGNGNVTLRLSARTSAPSLEAVDLLLWASGANGQSTQQVAIGVDSGAAFGPAGATLALPPDTTNVTLRIDLRAANATVDIASMTLLATP